MSVRNPTLHEAELEEIGEAEHFDVIMGQMEEELEFREHLVQTRWNKLATFLAVEIGLRWWLYGIFR